MGWVIEQNGYDAGQVAQYGNRFLIANGYMGYRGTLDEHKKEHLVACNIAGLYDQNGEQWRETVNAPNGLYTALTVDGQKFDSLVTVPVSHTQSLDMYNAVFSRNSTYEACGKKVVITSQRFAAAHDYHLLCATYSVMSDQDCHINISTGIDTDIWDLNGPHLINVQVGIQDKILFYKARTFEQHKKISVCEACTYSFAAEETVEGSQRTISINAKGGQTYTLNKFVAIYNENETEQPFRDALRSAKRACTNGMAQVFGSHKATFNAKWDVSDVVIEGDEAAQLAIRYSIYHMLIIAPCTGKALSIPARGLSSQVYKGAVFWDTEMFMLPFFLHTDITVARELVYYRINGLEGAKAKAREYRFDGAFYAWESQEGGKEGCTNYNVVDVFSGRPMRTFFRDKQIHISAAVANAIWQYYTHVRDIRVLIDGGAEVIFECAKFYASYAYYKPQKGRYEFLDVIGPDEYHERVNNNVYTNAVIKRTLKLAIDASEEVRTLEKCRFAAFKQKTGYDENIELITDIYHRMYMPTPGADGVMEQFDGYFGLEDTTADVLKTRLLDPKEYWGGAYGVASQTKVIKQADVVLMLCQFDGAYDLLTKQINYDYYKKRTEHGSSLSACSHCLLACEIDRLDEAYEYFMKTATVDLTGNTKQFAGLIYIGGTHPAANSGAWMDIVFGFAGVKVLGDTVTTNPRLPKHWKKIAFKLKIQNQIHEVIICNP